MMALLRSEAQTHTYLTFHTFRDNRWFIRTPFEYRTILVFRSPMYFMTRYCDHLYSFSQPEFTSVPRPTNWNYYSAKKAKSCWEIYETLCTSLRSVWTLNYPSNKGLTMTDNEWLLLCLNLFCATILFFCVGCIVRMCIDVYCHRLSRCSFQTIQGEDHARSYLSEPDISHVFDTSSATGITPIKKDQHQP